MAFLTVAEVFNRVPEFNAWYAHCVVDNINETAGFDVTALILNAFSLHLMHNV